MKKELSFMKLFTIAAICPPFLIAALFGLYYAFNGFNFLFSTSYGLDAFIGGGLLWFVIIYAFKLGLLALVGALYGIKKLFDHLSEKLPGENHVPAPMPKTIYK